MAQGLEFILNEPPLRIDPRAAADKPELARTDNSAASSMSLRIEVTLRKTPGSIGGGGAFPALGDGKGGGGAVVENMPWGASGAE